MKAFQLSLCLAFLFVLPSLALAGGHKKKREDYKKYQKEVYHLIKKWYSWQEKIRRLDEKQLGELLRTHSPSKELQKVEAYKHFERAHKELLRALELLVEVDYAITGALKMFRGATTSKEGRMFLYEARLHRLAHKLYQGSGTFWEYSTRRYFALKNKKGKKGKKKGPHSLTFPKYAPNVTLIDALVYRLIQTEARLLELAKSWQKSLKKVKPTASHRAYFHHMCKLKSNCPLALSSRTIRAVIQILERSWEVEGKLRQTLKKNPSMARVPAGLGLLFHERAKVIHAANRLLNVMGQAYSKFAKASGSSKGKKGKK